ncbi:MAG: protein kinase [Lentisphaerota bacterium]
MLQNISHSGGRIKAEPKPIVLIVDDEDPILKLLERQLSGLPAKIIPTPSPAEAIHILKSMEVAVLLCDLNMPEISGNAVLHTARDTNPNIVSIVVTGGTEISATIKAINEGGIWKFITKPWRQDELISMVRSALSRYETLCQQQKKLKALAIDVKAETRRLSFVQGLKKTQDVAQAAEAEPAKEPIAPATSATHKQIRLVKKISETHDGADSEASAKSGKTSKTLKVIKIAAAKPSDKKPRSQRFAEEFQSTRYTLKNPLGESPVGVVFRAEDSLLASPVAIKMISRNYTRDEKALAALHERAKKAMQLSHKHIVRLHGLESSGERYFLSMELVEGQSFKDVLKIYHKLPTPTALQIGRVGADALACAHRLQIVHGDIKPSNLLLTEDGVLKITDFGDGLLSDHLKEAREPGTLFYMSPERLRGEELDGRSDVYSLAMVLFELITGELPFPLDLTDPADLEKGPDRFDILQGPLKPVLQKALSADPAQRWETVEAFSRALMDQAG